jgi:hypothetical protein
VSDMIALRSFEQDHVNHLVELAQARFDAALTQARFAFFSIRR